MLIGISVLHIMCRYMRVSSYSKAGAVEQRDMVNSGAGDTKDRDLRQDRGGLCEYRTWYLACHHQVPSTGTLQY
jgi:hypothetical protein